MTSIRPACAPAPRAVSRSLHHPGWPLPASLAALSALSALTLVGALVSGCAQAPVKGAPGASASPASPVVAAAPIAAASPAAAQQIQPESESGWEDKPGWVLQRGGVAAANPLAVDAGVEMLRAGGNALDAAIAVQMVLTLVEPQSSGIGGGAFLLHWDGQRLRAFDGRETAPAAADESLFLQPDGKPLPFMKAVVGGRSVGTPGLLRMLAQAHAAEGRLPWAQLFAPAIRLCEDGFPVSARFRKLLAEDEFLARDPAAARYFLDADGKPWARGQVLRNPALAEVFRRIAKEGAEAFYRGPIAEDIVRRVRSHPTNPGLLSLADLAAYRPKEREPLCTEAAVPGRPAWRVCGFPPPSSGHLTVMQILGMLPPVPAAQALQSGKPGADWLHRYTEVARLAFADRNQYIADPDFVQAPGGRWETLLAPDYLRQRAALVGERSMGQAPAGQPAAQRSAYAPMAAQPEYGTSHISVVDREGRAVAMTTTIEAVFGAHVMSDGGTGLPGGFLLNNELTDFSMAPRDAQGRPVANRVEPGKRPRSSMSPTLVFNPQDGRLLLSLGSPGGQGIIHYVAKSLVGLRDWDLNLQQAFALPNFASFNGPTVLESGQFPAATIDALKARGHTVLERDMTSGLHGLQRQGPAWFGAADPRREGVAKGD